MYIILIHDTSNKVNSSEIKKIHSQKLKQLNYFITLLGKIY